MLDEVFVSYKERKDSFGFLYKEWRNELHWFHREDGPAYIRYNPNGLIMCELFYVSGEYLGSGEKGFWALWERLTEVERQATALLKYLAIYS